MFNASVYTARRDTLKKDVGSGLVLFLGNEESSINFKANWYHFRQDSSFLYFFGLSLPGLAAIVDIDHDRTTVFGDELSIDDIVWTGPQPTIAELANRSGVQHTDSLKALVSVLNKALQSGSTIHYLPPYRPENSLKLQHWLGFDQEQIQRGHSVELIKAIVAQRSYKSALEIEEINKAVDITADMHLTAMKLVSEGKKEMEIVGAVQEVAVGAGGQLSYPVILTRNGQILHNHYHGNTLRSGDMVLVDCGAEVATGYAGDMTRTFPVDSQFTERQKTLYELVVKAHTTAVDTLQPDIPFKEVHLTACKTLVEGLKEIGLMKGDAQEAVNAGAHTMFFQCGLGHMMGLDVHDMEDLGEQYVGYTDTMIKSVEFGLKSLRLGKALEPGFVITVEPGIYIIPELIDLWKATNKNAQFINYQALESYRDFGGIRVEEDFVITETGAQLLGKPVAKTAAAVESIRTEATA
ncbi:aminopeptidase P family protein [Fulvivirgaceae bacterium BMA12]|uniref:Xaa-Pro aminopeptidase n=1 Tax=Agaribacillus aureus TaxID=3051825 RepID=A0ABT8LHT5_9BACT|nr:aminopeptidase P family protein [Fulvivirgaceae bacterium BMA12]